MANKFYRTKITRRLKIVQLADSNMEEFRRVLDKDGEPLDTRWQDRLEEYKPFYYNGLRCGYKVDKDNNVIGTSVEVINEV